MKFILAQCVPCLQDCGFAAYFLRTATQKETQKKYNDWTRKKQRELTTSQDLADEEFSFFFYGREYKIWVT